MNQRFWSIIPSFPRSDSLGCFRNVSLLRTNDLGGRSDRALQFHIQVAPLFAAAAEAATSVVSAKVGALAQGVLKAMFLPKLKIATSMLTHMNHSKCRIPMCIRLIAACVIVAFAAGDMRADGLIYQLPADGAWVRYDVQMKSTITTEGKDPMEMDAQGCHQRSIQPKVTGWRSPSQTSERFVLPGKLSATGGEIDPTLNAAGNSHPNRARRRSRTPIG